MSDSNQENIFNLTNLIGFVSKNKIALTIICCVAFVVSLVVCVSIPPKYKSTVILFPTSSGSVSQALITESQQKKEILNFGEEEEVEQLKKVLPVIWEDLSSEAQAVIEKQGVCYKDEDGDLVTSIVNGKDCVFTCYDEKGCCYCAIEKAYREGKVDFYKPVSCHLYPIRVQKYPEFKAVNYHRWSVCKAAVLLGERGCACI